MAIVTANVGTLFTVSEVIFSSITVNIVQVNWTSTRTKVSISEGHCTCCQNYLVSLTHTIKITKHDMRESEEKA